MCHHLNIQMYIIFIWDIVGIIDNYIREKYVGTQKKKKKKEDCKLLVSHPYTNFFPNRNLMLERHAVACHYLHKFMLLKNPILMPLIELIFQEKVNFECGR